MIDDHIHNNAVLWIIATITNEKCKIFIAEYFFINCKKKDSTVSGIYLELLVDVIGSFYQSLNLRFNHLRDGR